ncbi:class I SAM-dependent methyltransferase [Methylobacterium trifolii]|uniref:Methyltransferase domain-containing protein n=1 Tax=Methylobacterium trifolii TaxID=1003092 RepID=A0ABQ4U3C0_9HYPH|nr:class I SAM-dependent methyltransferase [Methylobacterium trifolii]GJE61766.1 hypothetical protein MPOCJGCO_3892 [Methylobacterium trifolii]
MRTIKTDSEPLDYSASPQALEVEAVRRTLGRIFLKGRGIEVGAGTRPWKLPIDASCFYGDVLDEQGLEHYFAQTGSAFNGFIDAQTYAGIEDDAFDFSLSAHVLEHLVDPLGSIKNSIRIIRQGGISMFAVPDKRYTFDHPRPVTALDHLIEDYKTGGEETRIAGCKEHVMYLHPQWAPEIPAERIDIEAAILANAKFDTHYHTWTTDSFLEMLDWIEINFKVEAIHSELVVNENIAVLRKL